MNRTQLAALNNALWCAAVWRSRGLLTEVSSGAWFTRQETPSLYPNMVTVDPDDARGRQLAIASQIGGALRKASVKDSYAVLSLGNCGFQELFSAQWLWAAPGSLSFIKSTDNIEVVTDPADVGEWIATWEEMGGAANNLFPSVALDGAVEIWGKRTETGRFCGGLIAYRSSETVGITNAFGSIDGLFYAASREGSEAVCCYQQGAALSRGITQGFEAIGPLKVWITEGG